MAGCSSPGIMRSPSLVFLFPQDIGIEREYTREQQPGLVI